MATPVGPKTGATTHRQKISKLGKARHARDQAIARADKAYKAACAEAWEEREKAAKEAKREYEKALPHPLPHRS